VRLERERSKKEALSQGTRRFDMPDFHPRADWVREMKRYSILPIDCYATEQRYWQSLWYTPNCAKMAH